MDSEKPPFISRSIEIMLVLVVWKELGPIDSLTDLISKFVAESELHQIGMLACLSVAGRAVIACVKSMVGKTIDALERCGDHLKH